MAKVIKKIAKILEIIVGSILIILATIPILLQSSLVQNALIHAAAKEFSSVLNTKVTINSVDYRLFNSIQFRGVYVEDQSQDTLLFADKTDADFSFKELFHGKVIFTGIEFDKFQGNIKADTLGHTNFDFIIKALKSKNQKSKTNILYRINILKFTDSALNFQKQNGKSPKIPGTFNPDSIFVYDLNAELSLNIFQNDTLNAAIKSMSLKEKSGLEVSNLCTSIAGSKNGARIQFVELSMPESKINLDNIDLNYDSLADLKNFARKVKCSVPIQESYVSLNDLSSFVPGFKNQHKTISFTGKFSGLMSSLHLHDLEVKYGKTVQFNADIDLSGLPDIEETFVYAQINQLKADKNDIQDLVAAIRNKPFILPKELNQLGIMGYKGNISGFFSNLVAYGNLTTNVGSVSTDILLQFENMLRDLTYNGTIKSSTFQLGKLLSNKKFGKVAFNINTNGSKKYGADLKGKLKAKIVEFNFNNYNYKDVNFDGKYDGTGFDGEIKLADENINANFKGIIDLTKKLPFFDFDLKMKNLNLYALHLIKNYEGATLAFNGKTNMTGNSLDNINGFMKFDSITFTNKNKTFNAENLEFNSRTKKNFTAVNISSDILNGSVTGNFNYSTIGKTVNNIILHYLPSMVIKSLADSNIKNRIDFNLKLSNTKDLTDVLELPYEINGMTSLKGTIDEEANKIDINGKIDKIETTKQSIENITLDIQNIKQELKLTTRAQLVTKGGTTLMYLLAAAANDSVSTQLGWQNTAAITNAGEFQTVTKFRKVDGKTAASMAILPTQVIIADSIWDIRRANIELNPDSTVDVRNFSFENQNQYIHINGRMSKSRKDSLNLTMNHLNLDYIMGLLRLRGISIGGIVTGNATFYGMLGKPVFGSNLKIQDVSLNEKIISDADVNAVWNNSNQTIQLNGLFHNDRDTIALAEGNYFPFSDSIDVNFDTKGLTISFLSRYFDGVASNVNGYGQGNLRMFGPMKHIGFEGDILVKKGQAMIDVLKTSYFFNDSIHLTRHSIKMKNVKLYDEDGNQGTVNADIQHDGVFTNMTYNVLIKGKNIMALNTHSQDNEYFFGKAYVTGTVAITGTDKEADITINAVSQPKTRCYLQAGGASSASDNSFISFINPKSRKDKIIEDKKTDLSDFNTKVDMQISVTPEAEMVMLIDPKGGDEITGHGSGNLRVNFDTFSDIKLYGTYTFDVGYYLFTLQTVIKKEFSIDKGSTITWSGDPFGAKVDLRAIYSLTTSLDNLFDDSAEGTNTASVPVNCILKLTDDLMKPNIKFDIDLPQSDEGVKQKLKNTINTEEAMNRQIAYLMVLNKFYTPNKSTGWDDTMSFATSTLSAQLNSWIQKSFNATNFSLGFDWQKTQTQADEWKAKVNYQLNDRIIFYGNLGYVNDNSAAALTNTNASKFVGDFDVEYLLTQAGQVRLKAYSHTVDRTQQAIYREAKSTQGVGVIYKEEFESVGDMIKYYWRLVTGQKKKIETQQNEQ
ncbi:MAG: hypothetical protein PHH37_04625 [Paludibacter sp.]|nr:hypothetical protein [Paludibacter sp.]